MMPFRVSGDDGSVLIYIYIYIYICIFSSSIVLSMALGSRNTYETQSILLHQATALTVLLHCTCFVFVLIKKASFTHTPKWLRWVRPRKN